MNLKVVKSAMKTLRLFKEYPLDKADITITTSIEIDEALARRINEAAEEAGVTTTEIYEYATLIGLDVIMYGHPVRDANSG